MASEVRVTQIAREVVVQPTNVYAEVAQIYLDIAIMPNSDVVIYEQKIEVLRTLSRGILITRTLSLTGQPIASVDNNLGQVVQWFKVPKKKLIFFTTMVLRRAIDLGAGSVIQEYSLRLANHALNTRSTDVPANTEFIAVLNDQDIPPLRQDLADSLYGVSLPSFGKISINNADGQFDNFLGWAWEGGAFTLQLTGDRSELAFSFNLTIFQGVIGKMEYSDNMITAEVLSNMQKLAAVNVPTATFTDPNGQLLPSPICYGYVYNITPLLKDAVEYTFKIAGHIIADIPAVYDSGVALDSSQYTKDLTNAEFTLVAVPVGTITCDVKGKIINGVFTAKRGDFIYDLATVYGSLSPANFDLAALTVFNFDVPGDSGIWITNPTAITDVITNLLRPILGFVFFSRANLLTLGRFQLPVDTDSVALELTSSNIFPQSDSSSEESAGGDVISVRQVQSLYNSVTLFYKMNYTPQREAELGAADPIDPTTESGAARRSYLLQQGLQTKVAVADTTSGKNLYPTATDFPSTNTSGSVSIAEVVQSFFVNKTDADEAAQHMLDVFSIPRFVITVRTNLISAQATLHSIARLTYTINDETTGGTRTRFFSGKRARVVGYEENYGDNTATVRLFV